MKIEQFEDKSLSHYSYAIWSEYESKIVLIDPARDITPYLNYAQTHQVQITHVIETHPHADFVSGHLELHERTGADIYISRLAGAAYPHQTFDDGDIIELGKIKLKAWNTPGHSPDSISIVLEHEGKDHTVFTGDTLFIGDCGRPDLREQAGALTATRKELAAKMYTSLRRLATLDNEVWLYPAHGAGTLCGKALSEANRSTIGAEKISNWSLQEMPKEKFIQELLQDQPFIPKYFPYNVELNKQGADHLEAALAAVPKGKPQEMEEEIFIIDTRPEKQFKQGHFAGSFNIQNSGKFETWLGSIIAPGERFYLILENGQVLQQLISRTAKIGYEKFIVSAFVYSGGNEVMQNLHLESFKDCTNDYTIVDIRNRSEVREHPLFEGAITIPLPELRERANELPADKPVVVHCAGGYRSAVGSSILQYALDGKAQVYDLGEAVKSFM